MPCDELEVRRRLDEQFGAAYWLEGWEHRWADRAATAAVYVAVSSVGRVAVDKRLLHFGAFGGRACEWARSKQRAGRLTFGARLVTVFERPFGRAKVLLDTRVLYYAAFIPD